MSNKKVTDHLVPDYADGRVFTAELVTRVRAGLSKRISEVPALERIQALILQKEFEQERTVMMRTELLNLKIPADLDRWQELHNDPSRYEVLSTVEKTTPKGDYFVRIIYNEKGEDQPIVKSQKELREQASRDESWN